MGKTALYINKNGYAVDRHSYSGSADWNNCSAFYKLKRIDGWTEIEKKAAMPFGTCIEQAIRFFHETLGDATQRDPIEFFLSEWEKVISAKENKNLTFSKTEVNAENLAKIGTEMLHLYELRTFDDNFPYEINGISFQIDRRMEIADAEFVAYLDMLVKLKSGESAILDCKVSGAKIPDFIVLDPQLQSYSWIENNPNVGFLWFQKIGRGLEKGSEVTYLDSGRAGVVCKTETDDFGTRAWVVPNEDKIAQMDKLFPPKSRAAAVLEAKDKWMAENATCVKENALTKQKVHVRIARIPQKLTLERGRSIEQDILAIRKASEDDFFPQQGSVRFPAKCPYCPMRGICSGDDKVRDELVTLETGDLDTLLRREDAD